MLIFFAPGSSEVRPVRHFSRPPIQAESKHMKVEGQCVCTRVCTRVCVPVKPGVCLCVATHGDV